MNIITELNSIGNGGLLGIIIAIPIVLLSVIIHYEILYWLSKSIPKLKCMHGRIGILAVIIGAFTAHVLEIWIYAGCFYSLSEVFHLGYLSGELASNSFWEYLYFSTVTYTSLGVGDIYPAGALRMLAGAESLNGFILITWSASFAYLYMEKFWKIPRN